jgi:hypothetical protein
VYFDEAETYHVRAVVDAGNALGYFCHVMVRNGGRTVATKCQARLMEVRERNHDGAYSAAPGFVAHRVLKWAHEGTFDPQDIEPDLPRRLDLCYALVSSPNLLRFFTPPTPAGCTDKLPAGTLHRPRAGERRQCPPGRGHIPDRLHARVEPHRGR